MLTQFVLDSQIKSLLSRFNRDTLKEDFIAGISVGLVLVPQSLAYAQLAGLPAYYGLYASLLPPVIAAFFGSSPQLSTGPVAVLSLMTLSAVSPLAVPGSEAFISYSILLAFLIGVFMLILGSLRLGDFVSFLSHPVIYGFTNAAAIIIISTQLPGLLGITVSQNGHYYQTVISIIREAAVSIHWPTFIMGVNVLLIFLVLKKINKKIPAVLIVVLITIAISRFMGYPTEIVGAIPKGLPAISIPVLNLSVLSRLAIPVVTMSMIGFTEAISVAQAVAIRSKSRLDPNKELIGQGHANLIGSLNKSYPISGSFSRTAINFQAGAKTWASSLFTSLMIFVTILFFTDILYYLPKVVLASIIVFSVSSLIDFSKLKPMWSVSRYDVVAFFLAFAGTLYFAPELEKGVVLGVIFSVGYFIYRSTHPRVAFLSRFKDDSFHDAVLFNLDRCENIAVVRLDAPLYFANANYFENEIIKDLSKHKNINDILFVASGISGMDATGEEMLSRFIEALRNSGKDVYFSSVRAPVMEIINKSHLIDLIGKDNFFPTTKDAVNYLTGHINHKHVHLDENRCPLLKYVRIPTRKMYHQRSRREIVAYYYNKLFS